MPVDEPGPAPGSGELLMIILPLLIILSTLLLLLLLFLISIILLRRRRSIMLQEHDGPLDLSREESIESDGGFEVAESAWLESVSEEEQRDYRRAKEWQSQYPPNSLPTDITLSQFLSIQEKGVSAWSFEPDYEILSALLVHSRTEITFLPDPPFACSSIQSNLPLPKLNEVYYWEVKMFDLPETTHVAVGLATKPYPAFRLPGMNKFSVAYHSSGDKCHNYPFNATSFGSPLKEGDVIGVGFRPRNGTVFFTRNGRKTEDAFTGLSKWNLFPCVGADGPCSLHVNFGQSGFVFIEANVKKWGLAPMVGTLAPPPAYGSERGSILLAAGGQIHSDRTNAQTSNAISARRPSRRTRRSHPSGLSSNSARPSRLSGLDVPANAQPNSPSGGQMTPLAESSDEGRYISPTDAASFRPHPPSLPSSAASSSSSSSSRTGTPRPPDLRHPLLSPDSPTSSQMNPPTPHQSDIHLQSLSRPNQFTDEEEEEIIDTDTLQVTTPGGTVRQPPEYSPIDAYQYAEGVRLDLPAEFIQAAIERTSAPLAPSTSAGRRSRRR